MKRNHRILLTVLLVFVLAVLPFFSLAASFGVASPTGAVSSYGVASPEQYLSSDEIRPLRERARQVSSEKGFFIGYVLTEGSLSAVADSFFDTYSDCESGIVLCIDPAKREYYLLTVGYCNRLSGSLIDKVENAPLAALSGNDWAAGGYAFFSACETYLPAVSDSGSSTGPQSALSGQALKAELIALCISLVIALVVTLSVKRKMNNVRRSADAGTYINEKITLTERADMFLYSTESRVRISSSSSSSGGGSSRGGRSGHF